MSQSHWTQVSERAPFTNIFSHIFLRDSRTQSHTFTSFYKYSALKFICMHGDGYWLYDKNNNDLLIQWNDYNYQLFTAPLYLCLCKLIFFIRAGQRNLVFKFQNQSDTDSFKETNKPTLSEDNVHGTWDI